MHIGRIIRASVLAVVRIAGGRTSVPEPICRWGLVQFGLVDGELSEIGRMMVRIAPFGGEAGIMGLGGGC
jgi:hypothetical protein